MDFCELEPLLYNIKTCVASDTFIPQCASSLCIVPKLTIYRMYAEEHLDGLLKEMRRRRVDLRKIAENLAAINKRYTGNDLSDVACTVVLVVMFVFNYG